jgi:hypothetical protein
MTNNRHNELILLPGLFCDARLWAAQVETPTKLARTQIPEFSIGESIEAMADAVLGQAPSQFALRRKCRGWRSRSMLASDADARLFLLLPVAVHQAIVKSSVSEQESDHVFGPFISSAATA